MEISMGICYSPAALLSEKWPSNDCWDLDSSRGRPGCVVRGLKRVRALREMVLADCKGHFQGEKTHSLGGY